MSLFHGQRLLTSIKSPLGSRSSSPNSRTLLFPRLPPWQDLHTRPPTCLPSHPIALDLLNTHSTLPSLSQPSTTTLQHPSSSPSSLPRPSTSHSHSHPHLHSTPPANAHGHVLYVHKSTSESIASPDTHHTFHTLPLTHSLARLSTPRLFRSFITMDVKTMNGYTQPGNLDT